MSERVKDKTVFSWLKNLFKQGDGGVHNDHHESLSDEDKIVEDYLEVSKFVIKRMKLTSVIGLDCNLLKGTYNPIKAIMSDGSLVELDFDLYIHHDDADVTERLMEIEATISDCDKQYIQDKVIERSRNFYSNR